MIYHDRNESKTKKTQGEDSKENPTWLKKIIKPKDSEPKIRTLNDTTWHWCSKETGVKCLEIWRVKKPSYCRCISTKDLARGGKGRSIQKRLKLVKAMETLIKSSDDSDSDGDIFDVQFRDQE